MEFAEAEALSARSHILKGVAYLILPRWSSTSFGSLDHLVRHTTTQQP